MTPTRDKVILLLMFALLLLTFVVVLALDGLFGPGQEMMVMPNVMGA
jgi:hypothetical protein